MSERTLFDELEGGGLCREGDGESPSHLGPADSLWRECTLDAFMAMSEREQLDYCARRDEDSARFADNDEDRAWYLERAAWYRARVEELKTCP